MIFLYYCNTLNEIFVMHSLYVVQQMAKMDIFIATHQNENYIQGSKVDCTI